VKKKRLHATKASIWRRAGRNVVDGKRGVVVCSVAAWGDVIVGFCVWLGRCGQKIVYQCEVRKFVHMILGK
jgi:hypothetical protein